MRYKTTKGDKEMTTVHFNSHAHINAIQDKINTANQTLSAYININNMTDNTSWSFDVMYKLIACVNKLENDLYIAEYEDEQHRTW